jgi:pilus assembly protein TadC
MNFQIPFTLSSIDILKKQSKRLSKKIHINKDSDLAKNLKNSNIEITASEYMAVCFQKFIIFFLSASIILSLGGFLFNLGKFYLIGPLISFGLSVFVFLTRVNYPKMYALTKTRDIEKNLLSCLQDMLVQLNSGVPIFKILVNISSSDYSNISYEFKKTISEINSGKPQIEAIDSLGERTSSIYFRRVLWQLSNGMRAGSDMGIIIKESIDHLAKEQAIQIQNYGNKLNPIIMFYMLLAVITPALGITFLTIIASMLNINVKIVNMLFIGIFFIVILIQITFLGIIKTRRPSLL